MKTICVVEDHSDLRDLIQRVLSKKFSVVDFDNGKDAMSFLSHHTVHLLIVDLGLPGISGNKIIREMQVVSPNIPIVAISGQSILQLNYSPYSLGATHFLNKPFDVRELLALVVSMVNFSSRIYDGRMYLGPMCLDHVKLDAFIEDRPLKLSPMEFKVLSCLAKNIGEVVSRDFILEECWGESQADQSDRVVDYQIARIRKKIKNIGITISSKYSQGYTLAYREAA